MQPPLVANLVLDLLLVLTAGLVSGIICKRLGISMLVGYLVAGAVIGHGGANLMPREAQELEYLARAGALLLLFSIGIEFSLEELMRLSRYFFVGGSVQMVLVAVPVVAAEMLLGMDAKPAILIGTATALSSTVLVFKALEEWGQASSPHGRRAVGILLFQDVALVPLMLLVPLLTGAGEGPTAGIFELLAVKSAFFVAIVLGLRAAITRWGVPLLAGFRSVELVVLFAMTVLGGACLGAYWIGLPPALGALAAGVMLAGNRLSGQIDALILPYRETFAVVFFVSLGTLMRLDLLVHDPIVPVVGLVVVIALKTLSAAGALRLLGLSWHASLGMGLGLAQLGELSFVLLLEGANHNVLSPVVYNRMLFIALGTLIATPELLKRGLRWAEESLQAGNDPVEGRPRFGRRVSSALVVGAGPIGGQIASQLEISGVDVCLIDFSPVNLHPFAQQGFATVAGDAADSETLEHADAKHCRLVVITVPDDTVARQIVLAVRELNRHAAVLVRCRYQTNAVGIHRAGADAVVSEESVASTAMLCLVEQAKQVPRTAR
ncbi:MAG: sodium:proton exchanger [Rhodopirellula sp.]|nr:sodium:proton exchanger [Rhodopirellula sp.]